MWLLVYDNVTSPEEITDLLPSARCSGIDHIAVSGLALAGPRRFRTTASPAKLVRRPVRVSWTPPNAGVKCAKAMGVLDCQRGLSNSTHPLHRRQTYLRHGCWPLLNQNGVEPIKRVHPAGKSWHSRRNPNKRPWS